MLLRKITISSISVLSIIACSCSTSEHEESGLPKWVESDSVQAISQRTMSDFSLSMPEAKSALAELYPNISDDEIERYISDKYLEVKSFDSERRMHRKSPRNLKLLCPEIRGEWGGRGSDATEQDILSVDSITTTSKGNGEISNGNRITYKFVVDVPKHKFLIGDTLRVWMPLPIESQRQSNVKILSSIPQNYVRSTGKSIHNALYFEMPVTEGGDSIIHFEYTGQYEASAQYFSPKFISEKIKPYDKESELYMQYTAFEQPHIVRLDSMAQLIVGDEKSPYVQSELVFDYIVNRYPWAGAREYSTIECIPKYVISENHGDCGQVALLYISLMRTLGVPARWESGWMLHPGQQNLHDWAEVYFEGVGWVPIDVSFGRYSGAKNIATKNFFSSGMDQYRFATNLGVCAPLYPAKKYLRSETVDFQLGEVECSKGNLFYPGWKKDLEILKVEPLNN